MAKTHTHTHDPAEDSDRPRAAPGLLWAKPFVPPAPAELHGLTARH